MALTVAMAPTVKMALTVLAVPQVLTVAMAPTVKMALTVLAVLAVPQVLTLSIPQPTWYQQPRTTVVLRPSWALALARARWCLS
jgi:hypothetical protein